MIFFKKILISILTILIYFVGIRYSFGQTGYSIDSFAPIQMDIPCIDAKYDLKLGSRDYALFGNVMKLQLFLYQNEMMYYPPTGYFGPITQNALIKYQIARKLNTTGIFDINTRNILAQETCGVGNFNLNDYSIQTNTNTGNVINIDNIFNSNTNSQSNNQVQNSNNSNMQNVSSDIFSN